MESIEHHDVESMEHNDTRDIPHNGAPVRILRFHQFVAVPPREQSYLHLLRLSNALSARFGHPLADIQQPTPQPVVQRAMQLVADGRKISGFWRRWLAYNGSSTAVVSPPEGIRMNLGKGKEKGRADVPKFGGLVNSSIKK